MSFYQNGILISGVNTLPELTRAQYEALPADKRPEYWVCLDEEYEPSAKQITYDNKTSGATATNVQDAIDETFAEIETKEDAIPFNTFSITASNWTANSDTSTSTDYPYVYSVTTDKYTADSTPVWDLAGAGSIPTSTERESIDMILEAVFSTSGITLYATDEPTSDLTLRVKGK